MRLHFMGITINVIRRDITVKRLVVQHNSYTSNYPYRNGEQRTLQILRGWAPHIDPLKIFIHVINHCHKFPNVAFLLFLNTKFLCVKECKLKKMIDLASEVKSFLKHHLDHGAAFNLFYVKKFYCLSHNFKKLIRKLEIEN